MSRVLMTSSKVVSSFIYYSHSYSQKKNYSYAAAQIICQRDHPVRAGTWLHSLLIPVVIVLSDAKTCTTLLSVH